MIKTSPPTTANTIAIRTVCCSDLGCFYISWHEQFSNCVKDFTTLVPNLVMKKDPKEGIIIVGAL